MATGVISWSQTAATNATADSTISIPEGMAPSGVNDGMRAMMASIAKWRDDNSGSLVTGGITTAFTLATNQVFASLSAMDMQTVAFRLHVAGTAAATLNVDGLGAKPLNFTSGTPVGILTVGRPYRALYLNASNEFRLFGADV